MAVTTLGKPGDFVTTFTFPNTTTPDWILYGITRDGKVYRERKTHDTASPFAGGRGTWVDTGLTVADVATVGDL